MTFDISKIEASKRQIRRALAALPYAEKLRIVEQLREELLIGLADIRRRYRQECANKEKGTN